MNVVMLWLGLSLMTETLDDQYVLAKEFVVEKNVVHKAKQFFIDEYHKEQLKPRPIKREYLWYMKKNIKE